MTSGVLVCSKHDSHSDLPSASIFSLSAHSPVREAHVTVACSIAASVDSFPQPVIPPVLRFWKPAEHLLLGEEIKIPFLKKILCFF